MANSGHIKIEFSDPSCIMCPCTKCSRPTSYLNASVSGRKVTSAFSITPTYLAMRVTKEAMSMGLLPEIIFRQWASMLLAGEQRIFFAIAYRYYNSGKLQRRRSARGCMTLASHLARNLKVGLWMETMLFLQLIGSLEISHHHELRSY